MEYKISDICSNLSIGKSTIYKRMELLKKNIPVDYWKNNDYFYYDRNNKLFFSDKGYEYIKNFKSSSSTKSNNNNNDIVNVYQNQIIDFYKQRVEYLESENKRLLDIISLREQRDLAKDVKTLGSVNSDSLQTTNSFFVRFLDKFKRK